MFGAPHCFSRLCPALPQPGCLTNCLTIGVEPPGRPRTSTDYRTGADQRLDQVDPARKLLGTEEVTSSILVSPTTSGRCIVGLRVARRAESGTRLRQQTRQLGVQRIGLVADGGRLSADDADGLGDLIDPAEHADRFGDPLLGDSHLARPLVVNRGLGGEPQELRDDAQEVDRVGLGIERKQQAAGARG